MNLNCHKVDLLFSFLIVDENIYLRPVEFKTRKSGKPRSNYLITSNKQQSNSLRHKNTIASITIFCLAGVKKSLSYISTFFGSKPYIFQIIYFCIHFPTNYVTLLKTWYKSRFRIKNQIQILYLNDEIFSFLKNGLLVALFLVIRSSTH